MNQKSLNEFLELNNLNFNQLRESVYKDILEAILNKIFYFMKKNKSNEIYIKGIYRKRLDQILSTKLILKEITHCSLPKEDLIWLNKCLQAHFKKKDRRKSLKQIGIDLWLNGQKNCKICGKHLNVNEINVDHVIPWDIVGDELENNYQILCEHCNKSKGAHISQTLEKIIFNK